MCSKLLINKVIVPGGINKSNFEDKVSSKKPDLVIGADGVRSQTSKIIFGDDNKITKKLATL